MSHEELPIRVKTVVLPRPRIVSSHNIDQPTLPPLPVPELSVPAAEKHVFVGEQFQCSFTVENVDLGEHTVHFEVIMEPPSKLGRIAVLDERFRMGSTSRFEHFNVSFEVPEPGPITLTTHLRVDKQQLQVKKVQLLPNPAQPAISVRTKLSKGSSPLKAYVLETQVENLTDSLMVIETCALIPNDDWQIFGLTADTDEAVMLRPEGVHQYAFALRGGISPDVGQISVTWRREPLGVRGSQKSQVIRI